MKRASYFFTVALDSFTLDTEGAFDKTPGAKQEKYFHITKE